MNPNVVMKARAIYEFIGDTDAGLGYINGKEYPLTFAPRTMGRRIFGSLFGLKFGWKILVTSPFMCPYSNMEAFEANWKFKHYEFSHVG